MAAPDLLADVNGFLGDFNAQRGPRDALPSVFPSYYAPNLMFPDEAATPSPRSFTRSARSNSAYFSSCCFQTNTSLSTAPPLNSPPPPLRQRPALPTASPLVCEFIGLHSCDAVFDDEANWISHIVHQHLNNTLPRVSVCWFCNDVPPFKAVSTSHGDREACFRERMSHIAWHFRNGWSRDEMRPDFFLLDHVYQHGLISEDVFRYAKRFHEVPQIPNLYPAGWRPGQQGAQVEVEVGRSHRRRRRDRPSRGYHP